MGPSNLFGYMAKDRTQLKWIIVTVLGLAFSGGLTFNITDNTEFLPKPAAWVIMATLGGIIIGTGQWLIIRPLISKAWAWLPVFAGGWCLTALIAVRLWPDSFLEGPFGNIGCLGGVIVGALQWLIFWRHYRRSWLWPMISIVGAAVGTICGIIAGNLTLAPIYLLQINTAAAWIRDALIGGMTGAVAGCIYGFGTAFVLRFLISSAEMQRTEALAETI